MFTPSILIDTWKSSIDGSTVDSDSYDTDRFYRLHRVASSLPSIVCSAPPLEQIQWISAFDWVWKGSLYNRPLHTLSNSALTKPEIQALPWKQSDLTQKFALQEIKEFVSKTNSKLKRNWSKLGKSLNWDKHCQSVKIRCRMYLCVKRRRVIFNVGMIYK